MVKRVVRGAKRDAVEWWDWRLYENFEENVILKEVKRVGEEVLNGDGEEVEEKEIPVF